jgi:hypothetical protein
LLDTFEKSGPCKINGDCPNFPTATTIGFGDANSGVDTCAYRRKRSISLPPVVWHLLNSSHFFINLVKQARASLSRSFSRKTSFVLSAITLPFTSSWNLESSARKKLGIHRTFQNHERFSTMKSSTKQPQQSSNYQGASSEPGLRSPPRKYSERPTTQINLPVSPTSTADVFLILDEDLGATLARHGDAIRPRLYRVTFLDEDPSFFDDEVSEWSSQDNEVGNEDDDDELVGLSFVDDETPQEGK